MDLEQFFYIFIWLTFAIRTTVILSDRTFVKQTGLYNECSTPISFGLQNSSRLCAAECERISTCYSFIFNDVTNECSGSSYVYTNTALCGETSGLRYYVTEGVTLGSVCFSSALCPLQFSKCSNPFCVCESFAFADSTNSRCILNSLYGEQCTIDTDCTGSFMRCTDGYCLCQHGYRAYPPDYYCTEIVSTFGDPCTQHADCFDSTMECWNSTCTCKPGYSLVPTTQLCVENCTTYGSTYLEYVEWDLHCTSDFYNGLSVQACKDICSNNTDCLSMSYHFGLIACQTRFCDPMTNPSDFVLYNEVNTFVRNCA